MRFIARTSRNTGVAVGPVGLLFLAIGYLFLAALVAIGFVLTCLAVAGKWGVDAALERRRRRRSMPRPVAGAEPWARGHRESTPYERSLQARRR